MAIQQMDLITPPDTFTPDEAKESFKGVFEPGGIAEGLGFTGFEGKSVIDVGAGDGRYTRLIRELGAVPVDAVELHQENIQKGVRKGWHTGIVICANVIDLASMKRSKHKYDTATVMNLTPNPDAPLVLRAAKVLLKREGELVVTLTETWRVGAVVKQMEGMFPHVRHSRVWDNPHPQLANNVIIVGSHS